MTGMDLWKTLGMLGLLCILAVLVMWDLIAVIPRFGAEHFGAPEDIKEMVREMPEKPLWVNLLGAALLVAGLLAAGLILVFAVWDAALSRMSFWGAFCRFLILLEGYKLFDVVCFDYLMLTRLKLPLKLYPQTAGAKGYESFGFNRKSQIAKAIFFFFLSLILALGSTLLGR